MTALQSALITEEENTVYLPGLRNMRGCCPILSCVGILTTSHGKYDQSSDHPWAWKKIWCELCILTLSVSFNCTSDKQGVKDSRTSLHPFPNNLSRHRRSPEHFTSAWALQWHVVKSNPQAFFLWPGANRTGFCFLLLCFLKSSFADKLSQWQLKSYTPPPDHWWIPQIYVAEMNSCGHSVHGITLPESENHNPAQSKK